MLQVNGLQVPLYQVGEISEASTPAVDPGDDSTDLSTGDDA